MSLIKWNPEVFLPSTKGFFDDFFSDDFMENWNNTKFLPAVNIVENKKEFRLEMAVSGFKKEDFKIEMSKGLMTISAEAEENKEDKDEKMTRKEWRFSSFNRTFTLPAEVNADKIVANYDKGVLKVMLPKTKVAEEQVKKTVAIQ